MKKIALFIIGVLVALGSFAQRSSQSEIYRKYNSAGGLTVAQNVFNNVVDVISFNDPFSDWINVENILDNHEAVFGSMQDGEICMRLYYLLDDLSSRMSSRVGMSIERSEMSIECLSRGGKYLQTAADNGYQPAINQRNINLASSQQMIDIINSATTPYGGYYSQPSYNSGSSTYQQKCSLCGGKGWIPGCKTPTYGSTTPYFCRDCNQTVPASHSHDLCPSCKGSGQITKIR